MHREFDVQPGSDPYVEVHETHTGVVVLAGDRAYKAKRPVVTDFLDFSTREAREQALIRERELNGRLAAQAYLGIAHLTGPLPGDSEPVLVMRRYPSQTSLAARVAADADGLAANVVRVADDLADFHADAVRSRAIDACARVPAVTARWDDNLRELETHAGTVIPKETLDQVKDLAHQYILGRAVLFADRITLRRVVDGHGDLTAPDIFCLDDGPVLLDCLDFDDQLRHVDCVDDAAFLAMDLEYRGRRDLADVFIDRYSRRADEQAPRSLWDFYIAYRAVVRAKVDCIRSVQGHAEAAEQARRHLDLAAEHLRAATVRLIVVGGAPGTGKTTLARSLAGKLGAQVISTDDVRRDLQRDGVIAGKPGELDAGLYTPENVATVYKVVLRRAHSVLAAGRSVILDGTWRDPAERGRARELAESANARLLEMVCSAPLAEAKSRVGERTGSNSDATADIAEALHGADNSGEHGGAEDPWRGLARINTERPLADSVAEAQELCLSA
ncbi:bifunctional aminoglycoside phosphotransferase/ATP-binding protein [Mycolicibacterium palauense]|uniref:bifunctional aminoglycoside phosphotransferase/ATP-binding protein n=1 Tax=Mycolicibacterium palauense TaxID=2034511 RepID=UPI000BFECE72|nr:bifunctional aminoglycoside phosphotransferase/ATP-binding protein [Mycolicibacterium palauense]